MVKRKRNDNDKMIRSNDNSMPIEHRNPHDLWSEMDKIFDNFRSNFDELFWPMSKSHMLSNFQNHKYPLMDVADIGDRYELHVEIPGFNKEDIDIEVTPNGMQFSANNQNELDEKGKNWLRKERSSLSYKRYVEFPDEIRTDDVEAELNNGVLLISLPKLKPVKEQKAKKIKIK